MSETKTEQKLISLKINDRDVQVPPGTLLIEATRRIGTEVPSFCYYPGLSLQAACRMCLLEFLLTNHPLDCPVCDKGGECELQDMVFRYGADTSRFVDKKTPTPE